MRDYAPKKTNVMVDQKATTVQTTACIGAISSKRGMIANAIHDDSIDSVKFCSFLTRLMKAYGDEKFIIYMDSLRAHLSLHSKNFMDEHNMEYILAPVYSPEYNPAEMLIGKLKNWIRRERLNDLVNKKNRTIRYLIQESVKKVTL